MNDLDDLYQEVILDHNRRPRHFGTLADANRQAKGHNPLCGDRLHVQVRVIDGRVAGIAFEGDGCAISKASASLMTDAIIDRPLAEVEALFAKFHHMVTEGGETDPSLGKLAAFAGVSDYPARVKCASLPWHTLKAALDGGEDTVSTE